MFSSFKNLFSSAKTKENSENKDINNSENIENKDNSENLENKENEKEKMILKLAMEIYKEEDPSQTLYEISLFNQAKMYDTFQGEKIKNWK
jgi:hypothetical protein